MSHHRGRSSLGRPQHHRAAPPRHRQELAPSARRRATPWVLLAVGAASLGLTCDRAVESQPDLTSASAGGPAVVSIADLRQRAGLRVSRSAGRTLLDQERERARETHVELQLKARAAAERRRERREAAAHRAAVAAARAWRAPLSGYHITDVFGSYSYLRSGMHTGLDLAAPEGTPINSVAAGTVVFAGYDGSFGNKVIVRHEDGTETWYCHMSIIAVSVGQSVTNTTQVGNVGSTGNVTGPHLHLEVHPGGGDPVDPYTAMAAHGVHL